MASNSQPVTGCGVCNKQEDLKQCSRCKAIRYCCREHQTQHRDTHKKACNQVAQKRQILETEERKLRNAPPGDMFLPQNPFETCVGNFWGILGTRDYMRARHALVDVLKFINTRLSVEMQLHHIIDMLRLCRGDNLGVRDLAPGLMLRLGQDQECYDFVKWWENSRQDDHYDWGDPDLPYLDVKNADSFEAVEYLCGEWPQLSYLVPMTLLKIRLFLDLLTLRESESPAIAGKVPREILDIIQRHTLRTNIISQSNSEFLSKDHSKLITTLEGQIRSLWRTARRTNQHIWPLLLNPGDSLTSRPDFYSRGDLSEAQLDLQYSYKAWRETPGAIEVIGSLESSGNILR